MNRHPDCSGQRNPPMGMSCYCPACMNMRHTQRHDELVRIQDISEGRVAKARNGALAPLSASASYLHRDGASVTNDKHRGELIVAILCMILLGAFFSAIAMSVLHLVSRTIQALGSVL